MGWPHAIEHCPCQVSAKEMDHHCESYVSRNPAVAEPTFRFRVLAWTEPPLELRCSLFLPPRHSASHNSDCAVSPANEVRHAVRLLTQV
eukprot:scaffold315673_cov31-Tisochrysis_lutea.AAC.3